MPIVPDHVNIGMLSFPRMDQLDFTGAFEVLSRLPNSTVHVVLRKNSIWLPSDRDVGTCFFGFPALENLRS